jgi:acyl CoA:acetate/3-ketoacid CoA transferase
MAARILGVDEAVGLIPDGAFVAVSCSSGLNVPDSTIKAIGTRFGATQHPRAITLFCPISAGDMWGIKGMDHLAQHPGLMKRIVAGSYPSGTSSMAPPAIWGLISANTIEAYNIPSGVMFDMLRDAAARRPGVLTRIGLDTFVDPRRDGCRMNAAARDDVVKLVEFGGEEWLHFQPVRPNIALIRGTTADEDGNISMEQEGAPLGAVDIALAARNCGGLVIAQVKRLTARGSIPTQRVVVPSTLVDIVVVDPEQMQTTQTKYDPAISGEVRTPMSEFGPTDWGPDKVIARRAAMELRHGDVSNIGFGISALVPRILIEEGLDGAVTWAIEQGPVGGVPLGGFAFGCAANAQAFVPSPQQFTYFQGAGFDCCLLSFLQIDEIGSVNVSKLSATPHVTAGCGGFVDITSHARKIVFSGYFTAAGLKLEVRDGKLKILQEGRVAKFVPEVEQVSFSGRRGQAQKQDVTYVTERCVIKLRPEGLTVTEVAPGVDLERDILAQSRAKLRVANNLVPMEARLFQPDPIGLTLPVRPTRALAS